MNPNPQQSFLQSLLSRVQGIPQQIGDAINANPLTTFKNVPKQGYGLPPTDALLMDTTGTGVENNPIYNTVQMFAQGKEPLKTPLVSQVGEAAAKMITSSPQDEVNTAKYRQLQNTPSGQISPSDLAWAKDFTMKRNSQAMMGFMGTMGTVGDVGDAMAAKEAGATNPNFIKRAAMSLNQTNQIKLPADINAPAKEAEVQQTINDYVPGNSPAEKYKNLAPTVSNIETQINQNLAANSKDIPISDIKDAMVAKLQPLVDNGTISQTQAEQEADAYVTRIYVSAAKQQGLPAIENTLDKNGNIQTISTQSIPETVDSQTAFQMKQIGNSAAKPLFGKDNLNPAQQVTMALRNGMDNIITSNHPDVKQLTLLQSKLYDAVDSLSALSGSDRGIGIGLPVTIGGQPMKVELPGFIGGPIRDVGSAVLNKMANNPWLPPLLAGTGLLGAGYVGGKVLEGLNNAKNQGFDTQTNNGQQSGVNNQPGNEQPHGQSISQQVNYVNVKPNKDGTYSLPIQTSTSSIYMTDSQRRQLEQNLTPGTPEYTKIEQEYEDSQTKAAQALPGSTKSFMQNANNYVAIGNRVRTDLMNLPPDFLNSIKQYGSIKAYLSNNSDSPYAQELADIDALNDQYASAYGYVAGKNPGDNQLIGPGNSTAQAAQKWNRMMQYFVGTYQQYQDPYLAITSPSGVQNQGGTIQPAPFQPPPPGPATLPQGMLQGSSLGGLSGLGGSNSGGLIPLGQ